MIKKILAVLFFIIGIYLICWSVPVMLASFFIGSPLNIILGIDLMFLFWISVGVYALIQGYVFWNNSHNNMAGKAKKFGAVLLFIVGIYFMYISADMIIGYASAGIFLIPDPTIYLLLIVGVLASIQGYLVWNNLQNRFITIALIVLFVPLMLYMIGFAAAFSRI